jgi:predicted Co/Zn/Cd cation transporter (cation efflux family)
VGLLTATLEGFLDGHREGVLPAAAIVSGVLLLACFGLYRFVRGVDRETRRR